MVDFQAFKCTSCGSSVIETENEQLAECGYCGTKLIINNTKSPQHKNAYQKLIIGLILGLIMVIIVGGSFAFYLTQKGDNSPAFNFKKDPGNAMTIPKMGVSIVNLKKPKINSKAMTMTINPEDLDKKQKIGLPKITIVHKVQGQTSNGGLYWIVTMRNDSNQTVYRPGVIASLFDENNLRIEEQKGWSKLVQLDSGQQTEALLFIAKPPKTKFSSEFQGVGSISTFVPANQESIEVVNFIVKSKNNSTHVEIIGDVKNIHNYQVDFVRVIAIAKDIEGNTVGLADSFVSNSSLIANAQSGFKIKAGTFVAKKPATWTLWAFGQKHRDML